MGRERLTFLHLLNSVLCKATEAYVTFVIFVAEDGVDGESRTH